MSLPHTPARRDRYKAATATVTGLVAFGAVAGTGYVAGTVAHQYGAEKADEAREAAEAAAATTAAAPAPAPEVRIVLKRRPHRTVVRTEVVHRVSQAVARVGSGGTLSNSAPAQNSSWASSAGTSASSGSAALTRPAPGPAPKAASAPKPAPRPAPRPAPKPAPKPAPAPSSGS